MSARSYKDHKFAAFVSYAFKDNLASAKWVDSFHEELYQVLQGMLDDVDGSARPLRMIRENDIVGGKLAKALLSTVSDSFALMVVIGRNYPDSEWCLNELKYFRQAHGDAAFNERVIIVAMNQAGIDKLELNPQWRALKLNDNVWQKAFHKRNSNVPIAPYLDNGQPAPEFRALLLRIGERLRELAEKEPPRDADNKPRVLVGAVNAELQAAADALMGQLRKAVELGELAAAEPISAAELLAAADDPEALKGRMRNFDELVLPFNGGEPLLGIVPGGHLAVLRNCWLDAHEGRDKVIRWLDCGDVLAARPAAKRHEAELELARASAVKALPWPGGDASAVRILIESNPEERDEWKGLAPRIESVWRKLVASLQAKPPLQVSFGELRIDGSADPAEIAAADAVLLLWGKKPPESVTAAVTTQGKRVTRFDGRSLGLVARLLPPFVDDPAAHSIGGWSVISFARSVSPQGSEFVEVPEDSDSLEGFLNRVLRRRLSGGSGS